MQKATTVDGSQSPSISDSIEGKTAKSKGDSYLATHINRWNAYSRKELMEKNAPNSVWKQPHWKSLKILPI